MSNDHKLQYIYIFLQIMVIILSEATAQLQECPMFIIVLQYIHNTESTDYRVGIEVTSTYPTVDGHQHQHLYLLYSLLSKPRMLSYMSAISAGEWSGRWNVGSRAGIVVVQRCCVAVLRCRDFGCLALSCFSETDMVVSTLWR